MSGIRTASIAAWISARFARSLRLTRYGVEVLVVTVALWIPMSVVAWIVVGRIAALIPPPPPGVHSGPSEFPFVVLFVLLAVANHLSTPIVKRIDAFWARLGW